MSFFERFKKAKQKKIIENSEPIAIDTALLRSAVSQMRTSNINMYNEAQSIERIVDNLDGDWDSDVFKDFRTRVKKTGDVYAQYYNLLDNAACLMEGIAEAYENLEKTLANGADSTFTAKK